MSRYLRMVDTADDMSAKPSIREILPDWTIGHLHSRNIPDAEVELFADLIHRARTNTTHNSALGFLATLSRRELLILTRVHDLTQPLRIETLDEAQAMHLLNPFAVAPGQLPATTFPPPNAPAPVHRAWSEATTGQNSLELLDSMAPFLAQSAANNTLYDAQNNPIGCISPADSNYFDIYTEESFSYLDQITFLMEALKFCRPFLEPNTYLKRRGFLLHYRLALSDGLYV
ncbi:MAG: hypothetical protein HQL63_03470 [Magnetococcales bacterium]|nr:hypothetical protein [Magnetococcales bacterium]MBF0321734.1 hypothetical protein [Magnetococcales bacterium]